MYYSLSQIVDLLLAYKYFILLPVATVEGPIVSIIAGFLVASKVLNLYIVFAILMVGDMLGDCIYYSIGRWGGRKFIHKWGHFFRLSEETLRYAEEHFQKHPKKTLFFGKTQAFGSLILVAAGMAKMAFGKFIWLNFLASIIKVVIFLAIGYYFGQAYTEINRYINYTGVVLVMIVIIIAAYLFIKTKNAKNPHSN